MASVINFQDFKEGTREKYADYIQQLLDEASDIYEDIIIISCNYTITNSNFFPDNGNT